VIPQRIIRKADRRAQRRLRRVLTEHTYSDPTDHRTRLYHESERLLDRLKGEPSFDAAAWRVTVIEGEYAFDPSEGESFDPIRTPDSGDHYRYADGAA